MGAQSPTRSLIRIGTDKSVTIQHPRSTAAPGSTPSPTEGDIPNPGQPGPPQHQRRGSPIRFEIIGAKRVHLDGQSPLHGVLPAHSGRRGFRLAREVQHQPLQHHPLVRGLRP
jgi:hypothetical protein